MGEQELPTRFGDPSAFVIDDEVAIALLADLRIRAAMARGDFDDLPGSGRPLAIRDGHDPDWWLKSLMERERVALLPPSIQLRLDDAALDDRLDGLAGEQEVRREVEDFNARVIHARYGLPAGPPLITMTRDVDATVAGWARRRAARMAAVSAQRRREQEAARPHRARRRWPFH